MSSKKKYLSKKYGTISLYDIILLRFSCLCTCNVTTKGERKKLNKGALTILSTLHRSRNRNFHSRSR